MRLLFLGALACQANHAALGHQRGDAVHAQFGGFFNQPVHALVGRHAHSQVHVNRRLAFHIAVLAHHHANITAAHVLHLGAELAALAVEQGQGMAWLHAQHLHVSCGGGRQVQNLARDQGQGAVKAGHAYPRPPGVSLGKAKLIAGSVPSILSIKRKRGVSSL